MVDTRTCARHDTDAEVCGAISDLLARIGDKWSLLIVSTLGEGPLRFNELRRQIADISQKMLSSTLKVLERDGLVDRTVTPERPAAGRVRADRSRPRTPRAGERLGEVDCCEHPAHHGGRAPSTTRGPVR